MAIKYYKFFILLFFACHFMMIAWIYMKIGHCDADFGWLTRSIHERLCRLNDYEILSQVTIIMQTSSFGIARVNNFALISSTISFVIW